MQPATPVIYIRLSTLKPTEIFCSITHEIKHTHFSFQAEFLDPRLSSIQALLSTISTSTHPFISSPRQGIDKTNYKPYYVTLVIE